MLLICIKLITTKTTKIMTYFQEIKQNLENGKNYESINWYTINRPQEGLRMIYINDKHYFYNSLDSYARKVKKLLSRGC